MKKISEDIKRVFESKSSFKVLLTIGIMIVMLLVFSAGVSVGFHKASFEHAWQQHYNENFGMMPARLNSLGIGGERFSNSHGATGKIIKLELPNILVQDKENIEKVVAIDTNTQIQKGGQIITTTDVHVGDFIVAIGTPDDKGLIEAKFIRIIPSPELLK